MSSDPIGSDPSCPVCHGRLAAQDVIADVNQAPRWCGPCFVAFQGDAAFWEAYRSGSDMDVRIRCNRFLDARRLPQREIDLARLKSDFLHVAGAEMAAYEAFAKEAGRLLRLGCAPGHRGSCFVRQYSLDPETGFCWQEIFFVFSGGGKWRWGVDSRWIADPPPGHRADKTFEDQGRLVLDLEQKWRIARMKSSDLSDRIGSMEKKEEAAPRKPSNPAPQSGIVSRPRHDVIDTIWGGWGDDEP